MFCPSDIEATLRNKLQEFGSAEKLEADLDKLLRNIQDSLDPDLLQEMSRLRDPDLKMDWNKAKNLVDKIQKDDGLLDRLTKLAPGLADKKTITDLRKRIDAETRKKPWSANVPKKLQLPPGNSYPPSAGINPDTFAGRLRDWLEKAKNWRGLGRLFRESPAFKKLADTLLQRALQNAGGGSVDAGGLLEQMDKIAGFAGRGLDAFPGSFARLPELPTPHMPTLPNFSMNFSMFSHMPALGPSGPAGTSGFGAGLVWIGVAGIGVLLLWQLWGRFASRSVAAKGLLPRRLGAWPVHPARVASREELIQAFEYLSLLRLGMAARTWNHREIAVGLGAAATGGSPERQAAANWLAALYEQARYAPENEPLPGAALVEARRNLCLLSGVAAA
jgi:hypothetical protein